MRQGKAALLWCLIRQFRAEARLRRAKAKVVLGEGVILCRQQARAQMTFEEAARKWHGHRLDALEPGMLPLAHPA